MRDAFSLAGRRALITGASRGIGRGIALAFAEAGADVTVAATDARKLDDVAAEARRRGVAAHALAVDLTDVDAVLDMVDQAHAAMGGLDVLVNNAAVHGGDAASDTSVEEYERLVNVNLRAPVFAAQRAAKYMRAAGGGVIVNISSTAAVRGLGVYGAVKAGLESLTEGLARSWGPDGIRVVAIQPGLISTDATASLEQDPERLERFLSQTHLRRIGQPRDVAGAAVFLASDAASFITGVVLPVSGGRVYKL
ncbi:MAG: SDR family oxidoreductase [Chloroflexota bacterium]|nr:SDR family oxidoreductase [Chloroflexota bacterium]